MELAFAFLLGGGVMFLLHAAWQRGFGRGQPTELLTTPALDLNEADEAALSQLPGLGPQRAKRIVEHRQAHGAFSSIDDLVQVDGLGSYLVQKVRPALRVTGAEQAKPSPAAGQSGPPSRKAAPAAPLDVNAATAAELMRLPGIGPTLAERIVDDRRRRGPYLQLDDLARIPGIKAKTIEKLRPYLLVPQPPLAGRA